MNPDKISTEKLFASMETQEKNFDAKKVDRHYHELFPDKLAKYVLVKPSEVNSQIDVGSIIRHTKKRGGISREGIVVNLTYADKNKIFHDKRVLDRIIIGMWPPINGEIKRKKVWEIFPSNHYIFVRSSEIADQRKIEHCEKLLEKRRGNVEITEPPIDKVIEKMKHMGYSNAEINRYRKNNEKINEILGIAEKKDQ